MLGTKPGIVMWLLMGIITGMYLNLAAEKRGMRDGEGGTGLHVGGEKAGRNSLD